ncbi:hypothetical protein AB1L30_01810 [Bremerella sp. JC817]|uniref:hypothetical protein n=1 Tax=Bremerella sp. JC817 TaxID=3231756 RepID=UPI00345ABDF0
MLTLRRATILFVLLFMQVMASPVFAQGAGEEEEGKSWVLAYIYVVLLVSLGVMVVGFGTNRENEEARKKERKEALEKEERLKKLEGGH